MDVIPSDNNQRISGAGQKDIQSPLSKDTVKRPKKEGSTSSVQQGDVLETSPVSGTKKESAAIPVNALGALKDSPMEQDRVLSQTKSLIVDQPETALQAQAGNSGSLLLKSIL